MAQLLIELFSEEIPARMQLGAARDFERLMGTKFAASGLSFAGMKAYVSPRRLALVVDGLPVEQAAVTEEVKGPREGAPEQAMAGFLRKVGLNQDQLVVENGVWMARIEKPGRRTVDVLPDMLREVILSFPWPKSMRSGTSSFRWVRPLKRILFLFDGAVVPFELEGIVASNLTQGHRFLGSGEAFAVSDFDSYQKGLRENFVILDHAERQVVILDKARSVCAAAGCELIEDQGLLEEVAGLNEWPVPMLGDMDPQFLTLPPEVIKTSMRTHQKYFAVRDSKTGKMAPHFVLVANIEPTDDGSEIRRGNAKVLSARLSDGVFFWKEDNRAGNFDQWLTKLEGTTFHVKLGTMKQRVERIVALAKHLAPITGADVAKVEQAAYYAKADLASYMVGEFPELQGVMGGYYADAAGLDREVADAIRQHYKPQGPSDSLPEGKVATTVALADKLDTLIGFFAIGEKPTGSKDPYALRRSALGVLRIIRDSKLRLPLSQLVWEYYVHWYQTYVAFDEHDFVLSKVVGRGSESFVISHIGIEFQSLNSVASDILDFFNDRLKVQLREEGHAPDVLDAVFALKDDDILRLTKKLDALEAVLAQGDDLIQTHKRAANFLSSVKWTMPATAPESSVEPDELEIALVAALLKAQDRVKTALQTENYAEALQAIAALRQNVDGFLDGVLVNAEDAGVRAARLNLLAGVCALSTGIADLSRIAG
ncbi:MAG TPA: glycine--tRNA ligase subunit beta [Asticcacaulis sp.]|nr:glycine--tRNA ligase subunit beta [Asticcacaulis sp.]